MVSRLTKPTTLGMERAQCISLDAEGSLDEEIIRKKYKKNLETSRERVRKLKSPLIGRIFDKRRSVEVDLGSSRKFNVSRDSIDCGGRVKVSSLDLELNRSKLEPSTAIWSEIPRVRSKVYEDDRLQSSRLTPRDVKLQKLTHKSLNVSREGDLTPNSRPGILTAIRISKIHFKSSLDLCGRAIPDYLKGKAKTERRSKKSEGQSRNTSNKTSNYLLNLSKGCNYSTLDPVQLKLPFQHMGHRNSQTTNRTGRSSILGSHQINSNVALPKKRDSLNYTQIINSIDCPQEPPLIRLQGGLGLEKLKSVMFADDSMIKVESNGKETIELPIYDAHKKKITSKKLRLHSIFRTGDISPASKGRSENLRFMPQGETIL